MADDNEQIHDAEAMAARIHRFAVRVARICGRASPPNPPPNPRPDPPPERES